LSSTIHIKIQGREYSLRSQESEEKTQRVVTFVEQRLAEIARGQSVDTTNLIVLTLLNLAGQYLQLVDEKNAREDFCLKRLEALVDKLEDE
jgi:cell division protein ZapA